MIIIKLALPSALVAFATGCAIATASLAAAATIDPGPSSAGPKSNSETAAAPVGTVSGPVALPPGGPVVALPQAALGDGANPYVPYGTDPFVPFGTWTP